MDFKVIIDIQTPNTPEISDVSKFIETNSKEIEAFKEYAISITSGIGLAANQCSLNGERFNLRMVAVKDSNSEGRDCVIAIDPKITRLYGIKMRKYEGCLTWKGVPNMTIVADRYYYVDVEFYTPDGEFHKETHKGFQAQVWQHEINHINGFEELVEVLTNYPPRQRIERNDDCPCGSGKKLKKCCIADYEAWSR